MPDATHLMGHVGRRRTANIDPGHSAFRLSMKSSTVIHSTPYARV
jgi:hypothetical protein